MSKFRILHTAAKIARRSKRLAVVCERTDSRFVTIIKIGLQVSQSSSYYFFHMQVNFREYSDDNVPKNDTIKLIGLNSEYNFGKNMFHGTVRYVRKR